MKMIEKRDLLTKTKAACRHLYEKAELVRLSSLTKVLLTFPLVVAICRLAIAKKLCVTAKEFTIR